MREVGGCLGGGGHEDMYIQHLVGNDFVERMCKAGWVPLRSEYCMCFWVTRPNFFPVRKEPK